MEVFERFSKHWILAQKHFVPFIFLMEMFARKSESQSLFDTVVSMLINKMIFNQKPQAVSIFFHLLYYLYITHSI